jgi:hypothetical protein
VLWFSAAATVSPLPCGNATVYCPVGSQGPTAASPGFYTAAAAPTNATDVMARAVECPPGSYCLGGVRFPCPAGTFVGSNARSSVTECRTCTAGGYCPAGSGAATPCGNDTVYCPAGSVAPVTAGQGYFTEGTVGSRVGRVLCDPGYFCPGDGRAYACPAGRYGDTPGLTNATCSGVCADGLLCALHTASAAGQACPTGQYCAAGLAHACPSGTYNPTPGAVNASQCLLCPAGTFNAGTGSSSEAECLPCPEHEGSLPGATACWPGVMGTLRSRQGPCVLAVWPHYPQYESSCVCACVCTFLCVP